MEETRPSNAASFIASGGVPSTTAVSIPALLSATPRVSPTRPPPTMTTSLSIRPSLSAAAMPHPAPGSACPR